MKQTIVLCILDGWGIGEKTENNAIYIAQPKAIEYIEKNFPAGSLNASGLSIGLPWEEEGNSEVGHLTIGAGRVLYQHFMRITKAIENGKFFKNKAFLDAIHHSQKNRASLHLVGLLTAGNVHASLDHLKALIKMAKLQGVKNLYLHLFADGKDSPPHSVEKLLAELQLEIDELGLGQVASLSGRFFAMDRNGSWDRTKQTYLTLTGKTQTKSIDEVINEMHQENLDDAHLKPTLLEGGRAIEDGDAIIFFNFREDSMQQIVDAFDNRDFEQFQTMNYANLHITTMTSYSDDFKVNVAFPPQKIKNVLGEVLSQAGKRQLRVAEKEKFAHVTYFFNGLKSQAFPNEYRVEFPSPKTARPEQNPRLMSDSITDRVLVSLRDKSFDFILVNYANPDVVAHTANFQASLEAIKAVDEQIQKLITVVLEEGHTLIITSDHGNAEMVFDLSTGETESKHNANPVPFYLVGKEFQKTQSDNSGQLDRIGLLSDVAPTILEIMNIKQPAEMTGTSLLRNLNL